MGWRTHLKQYSLTSLARPYKDTADSLAYCSSLQLGSFFPDPIGKILDFSQRGLGTRLGWSYIQYIIHNLQNQAMHIKELTLPYTIMQHMLSNLSGYFHSIVRTAPDRKKSRTWVSDHRCLPHRLCTPFLVYWQYCDGDICVWIWEKG